ncbi:MAG: HAMP domain-containing histidine kinase [Lachnospiraceae bacterium]|nr:HAMP domain-containing histidine kinase [Lachnospiraceae bacterium]
MKWTLARKFRILSALFMALSFLLIAVGGTIIVRRHLLNTKVSAMNNICTVILSSLNSQTANRPDDSPQNTVANTLSLMSQTDEYTIWIIGTDGTILASSDSRTDTVIPFNPALKGTYFRGTYNEFFHEDTISVYAPVIPSGEYQPSGYILVHYPYASLNHSKNMILNRFFLLWGFCVVLWGVFALILYRMVHVPLKRMLYAAEEYMNNRDRVNFSIRSSDEFGSLSSILNRMFSRFQAIHADQRQFIANISHDLRSPLTSIKGYLEAIQDGTIPPELEGKYINIVINETNRLTDLTQNLLTLNALDSSQEPLERTRFDIHSVIRQVLLTFEQRCQKKGIHFNLIFQGKSQMVSADLIKIQQVLYNLIDNAIKFSPPDAAIDITTTLQYEKIFVSIRDYGEGIPPDSLDKIWQRFYKTDPSRGRDKKGTGLGLSIVQDIIRLHEETIHVNSTLGEGSEFIFSLAVAAPA